MSLCIRGVIYQDFSWFQDFLWPKFSAILLIFSPILCVLAQFYAIFQDFYYFQDFSWKANHTLMYVFVSVDFCNISEIYFHL